MKARCLILLIISAVISGCSVSGISLNSMYLKQNYIQIIKHANHYQNIDDYGVLKICQSLIKIQKFDDFYQCYQELEIRVGKKNGTLTGQIPSDILSKTLTAAIFDSMQAEAELGLGNYNRSIAFGESSLSLLDAEPYSIETIVDVAGTSFEVIQVLLSAYSAIENKSKTLSVIEKAKGLSNFKYGGDDGFRLIKDFKIFPILAQAYFTLGDHQESLKYSTLVIKNAESLGYFETVFYSAMTTINSTVTNEKTADDEVQRFADTMFANRLQSRVIKARSELELGKYNEAKAGFDEVLSSKLITGITSMYYPVLHDRGRVAEALGDNESAEQFYQESIDVIENSRSSLKRDSHKIAYVGNKQDVYGSLVKVLYNQNKIAEAFEVAENSKARALVDLLADKSGAGAASFNFPSFAADSIKGFNDLQAKIDNKGIVEASKARSIDRGLLLKARRALKEEAPEYASLVTVSSTNRAEIQKLLADGELLLEYYGVKEELFIFAVTNKKIKATRIKSNGLHELVSHFRDSLHRVKSDEYKIAGKQLYNLLIKPAIEDVANATAVSIVPHGVLHYLPFDALYTGHRFLIDTTAIRMLPSASVMKFLKNVQQPQTSILVLGNPDLKDSSLDLAGAQQEAIAIAKNQHNAKLLLRGKATETAVKTDAKLFKYLHFASHGVFYDEAPLDSSLLLSADAANDGRLTVNELYSLKLSADLVTLSACETALGKVANGDDVVGFTRGFLHAGANTIVSSLWKVDDEATNQLMQIFYQNLNKMDKRSALTKAQLVVKKKYQHPYYWAAFQVTGAI